VAGAGRGRIADGEAPRAWLGSVSKLAARGSISVAEASGDWWAVSKLAAWGSISVAKASGDWWAVSKLATRGSIAVAKRARCRWSGICGVPLAAFRRAAPRCGGISNGAAPTPRRNGFGPRTQCDSLSGRGLGQFSVNDQQFADGLDRLDPKLSTYRVQQDLALVTVGVQQSDLDQTVGIQGPINFSEYRFGQAGPADHDHGL